MPFDFIARLFGRAKPAAAPARAPVAAPSKADLDLVKHYESCAKKRPDGLIGPYLEYGKTGVPTIGWGSTYYEDGRRVTMADPPITQERADALFDKVYGTFRKRVAALLPPDVAPHELGALTSLAYNIGIERFTTSTALARYKAGDKAGCASAMEWWNKDDGLVVRGLQKRRRAERLVFEGTPLAAAITAAEFSFPAALTVG